MVSLRAFLSFFLSGRSGGGSGVLSRLEDGLRNERNELLLSLLGLGGVALLAESDEVLSLIGNCALVEGSAVTFSLLPLG